MYRILKPFSSCINIVLVFFHILVLRDYWVLKESSKPLELVLPRVVRIVALSIISHEQIQKTESAVFDCCRFSLFLKDLFSRLFRGRNNRRCFCVGLLLPVHRYSVDIFIFWSFRNIGS